MKFYLIIAKEIWRLQTSLFLSGLNLTQVNWDSHYTFSPLSTSNSQNQDPWTQLINWADVCLSTKCHFLSWASPETPEVPDHQIKQTDYIPKLEFLMQAFPETPPLLCGLIKTICATTKPTQQQLSSGRMAPELLWLHLRSNKLILTANSNSNSQRGPFLRHHHCYVAWLKLFVRQSSRPKSCHLVERLWNYCDRKGWNDVSNQPKSLSHVALFVCWGYKRVCLRLWFHIGYRN